MCYFHVKGHKLYVEHIRHQLKSIIFPPPKSQSAVPDPKPFR